MTQDMQAIARAFREECDDIYALVKPLGAEALSQPTLFKAWSINDIMAHLHLWNIAVDLTLHDPDGFAELTEFAMGRMAQGSGHVAMQNAYFDDLSGPELMSTWRDYYGPMAQRFAQADPAARVKWVGPDMSVASSLIARQMEHWAHAQAIYDILGVERVNAARLRNVAHIGVTTYSWSFRVNGLEPPHHKPYVRLTAPDGEIWEWNNQQEANAVIGSATEFCQVVTQCRNVGDTTLQTIGDTARAWMGLAQCFAGGAQAPPAKGARHRA